MNIGVIVAAILISLAIGAIIGVMYRKKIAESKVGNAEEEAKRIVNMAKIEAENLKKEEIIKAKEEIMETDIPYIINKGRKGGSNVAAAICNALLYGIK